MDKSNTERVTHHINDIFNKLGTKGALINVTNVSLVKQSRRYLSYTDLICHQY